MVGRELFLPDSRELIELRALFAFGQFPFGLYPFLPFETMQSWVQRSGLHCEYFAGPAADHLCNGVTVHGFAQKRLQDEHVQRSLQQLNSVLVLRCLGHLDVEILLPWMETVYLHVLVTFSKPIMCPAENPNMLSNCSRAFSPRCSATRDEYREISLFSPIYPGMILGDDPEALI